MATADPQAPATKEDIRLLMEQLGSYYDRTENRIGKLEEKMEEWKEELIEHFNVAVETIRFELRGANRDEIEWIKDELAKLKQHQT